MTAPRIREIRPCGYCLGLFRPGRADAKTCSDACRTATRAAVTSVAVLPAFCRRDSFCDGLVVVVAPAFDPANVDRWEYSAALWALQESHRDRLISGAPPPTENP